MLSRKQGSIPKNKPAKIIGIQFSILSPEEIRKSSVAEITSRDTYINNKPVINGLFDPRMGVLDPGMICPTDGLDHMKTPGYFGHIELARPVFYIQYLSTLIKIHRCVCIQCSKLLLSKERYKHLLDLPADKRWAAVFAIASKIERCGEETLDGCNCKQPKKIKKEGIAHLVAEWSAVKELSSTENEIRSSVITPEISLKILRRISDEDVNFMGFSPKFSRPDWMICQVLAVPPPAVRPSVKHDAQQRSEDDLSHILVSILKANKTLQEKIQSNAKGSIINEMTTLVQYYTATLVDNKIPGVAALSQRSGRPLKSIKERLNGKFGRVRGNLMGKRVDYSSRSVITPDPNISARELGVPMKIAKNLTIPVTVNKRTIAFLTKLIQNGPNVHPGAKLLIRKTGENIYLENVDRDSIQLQHGDIVHRHMMNGDAVLFNRQPTLHRMSMMCHIAKIMPVGDTFRMNVADTKPYNADFDGDEMNLHMPQDVESSSELLNLAAVPWQIISPANNKSIVGIFQDSLLGAYRITRKNIKFSMEDAMNLLMSFDKVDISKFPKGNKMSSFELLSQILPPLSLKYKSKLYDDDVDEYTSSNNVLEIKNGEYLRGQMEKGVLGDGSKGLIHRICNDFGNMHAADFIDNLQNIVTEYMKTSAYSVGISDLIADAETNNKIAAAITEKKKNVQDLIDQTHLGIFENKTGKTNKEEFETQVNNILGKALSQAGRIGLQSLSDDNRFVIMVKAGSKGGTINISQMISCLGQQQVDGKRVPYGFEDRTLPHYTKFDDSPAAGGFVESSFMAGLTPQELFFHAMGGRVGLIDTAVKTSQTGYIQRRLIKSLEDLKVEYDMTVRNNKGKIIQYTYGDDGFDTVKVESQVLPIVQMTIEDIYAHFQMPDVDSTFSAIYTPETIRRIKKQKSVFSARYKNLIEKFISSRENVLKNVFGGRDNKSVNLPVAFGHIINNVRGQQFINSNSMVDITPTEAFEIIDKGFEKMQLTYVKPTALFELVYYYYLTPSKLLSIKRFNRNSLTILIETIVKTYKQSIVAPGEMVGLIAAQSIGEPTTQMSNLYHEKMRLIVVSKKTKDVNVISIKMGEFIDNIINKHPEYTFNTGHVNSVETLLECDENDYYVIGVDTKENTKWNKISHVSRHPVNGKLIEIKTKSGRKTVTTASHSHVIRCKTTQSVVPIKASELSIGMRVPSLKSISNSFINDSVTDSNGTTYVLDNLFGFFIGAYLAEGSLNGNNICISNINDEYANKCIEFADKYNIKHTTRHYKGEYGPSRTTNLLSKSLKNLILEYCSVGSFNKKVPSFAFTSPTEFIGGILKGYFDGDGNIISDKNHNYIRACSRSKELILDIGILLNYLDIFATFKECIKADKLMYNLTISNKYATTYQSAVGTIIHTDKLDNLVRYSNRIAYSYREDIDKINGLGHIIAYCGKSLKLPSRLYNRWSKKNTIGRRTLEKYISTFESHTDSNLILKELEILKQACYSGVVWDEIVEINEYLDYNHDFVYDFTVPGNQTFMTETGLIVHNTLNSFVYETEILVRDSCKNIKKVQMGDFVNKLIVYGNENKTKMEYYPEKDTTYAPTLDNEYWEIQAPDDDGNIDWYKIEAGTRHPVINEDGTNTMLKVITEDEQEVIATKAKSFLMLKDGKLLATRGDELSVGDYVPISTKVIDHETNNVLHLQEILPPTEYLYGSEAFKAMSYWTENKWWSKHHNKDFTLPYKRSDSFRDRMKVMRKGCENRVQIENGYIYPKKTWKYSCNLPENIPLDYDFGFLIGAYSAEGCLTRTQISISNNDLEYHVPIQRWCDKYNITTKQYIHENKIQQGWTSSDIRIYSIVLTNLLEKLCGKLSHGKFIHQKLVFSNDEFKKGFINGYIGGDGSIETKKSNQISSYSVSYQLLSDFNVMLKTMGIYSYIRKRKLQTSNNRGTKPENIRQGYSILIRNSSMLKLAKCLENNEISYKAETARKLMEYKPKTLYNKQDNFIPNKVNGVIVMEPRDDKMKDVLFVKIKSIEEVPNTTDYAYDLTVETTRNFVTVNGMACLDTFHFAGVASKSNVTRGVPRIEEILSLSENPKNPSCTIHLFPGEELKQENAQKIINRIEHTKLREVVDSISICFDPDDTSTTIGSDAKLMEQYNLFESMVDECLGDDDGNEQEKSKWLIRMELNIESMLDRNITMDDIHFAIKNTYKDEVSCIFSDYNDENLVFRLRLNNILKKKSIKKNTTLDQQDEIYMLKNFQDQLLDNLVIRGIQNISKVLPRKITDSMIMTDGTYKRQETWVLDTVGTNLVDILGLDYIDYTRTYTNDIQEIYRVLGIEAARHAIFSEISDVIEFDNTYINYHHLTLLCDRMTCSKNMISVFRHGINNDNIGPIAKASFEETPEMFLKAARHGELDPMRGVSANVMCGQEGYFGTSAFKVVLDIDKFTEVKAQEINLVDTEALIQQGFTGLSTSDNICSANNLEIKSTVESIKPSDLGDVDDTELF